MLVMEDSGTEYGCSCRSEGGCDREYSRERPRSRWAGGGGGGARERRARDATVVDGGARRGVRPAMGGGKKRTVNSTGKVVPKKVLKAKKGTTKSAASRYVTRNQALNRLQLKLGDFRRLCILKGIHPREPKKKTQGQGKTYYHVKDIAFLHHEPLLEKFRELRAYARKLKRAKAKQN